MNYFQDQNPNPNWNEIHYIPPDMDAVAAEFDPSNYLMFVDSGGFDLQDLTAVTLPENADVAAAGISTSSSSSATSSRNMQLVKKCKNTKNNDDNNMEVSNESNNNNRVAFRTESDLEIMDDGFKWRKYGKKSVKNNLNPRNYYKCSSEGCNVKKRVERDNKDSRFVITTYDGIHNHESPTLVYKDLPLMVPNILTLQDTSSLSSYSS